MKKITVEIKDDTSAELTEEVTVNHLSDLGDGVKDVIDDFVAHNDGVLMPPISITAVERKSADSVAPDEPIGPSSANSQ